MTDQLTSSPPASQEARPRPQDEPRRAFVIDDDDVMLLSCRRLLEKEGYQVETFDTGLAGIARIAEVRPQVLLVDLKMPELDGIQVIERVRKLDQNVVIVVITGYATIATAVDAMKAGAYDFLPKPFTPDELRLIVRRCHERWCLAREAERLQQEKEEAERRFITFVSHQLKTPLSAVKQYLDVLLYTSREELSETVATWLQRSQVRLTEMLELIGDWLTMAKVESGALVASDGECDLVEVIRQITHSLQVEAEAAQVTLDVDVEPELPPVCGDSMALGIVIGNLMSNAIKYNRPGHGVRVSAARQGEIVIVQVSDSGLGIAAECLPHLFTEFYRSNDPEIRATPGSGLGLAICKKVMSELGGTIAVESEKGIGTTFTVRIPITARSTPTEWGRAR